MILVNMSVFNTICVKSSLVAITMSHFFPSCFTIYMFFSVFSGRAIQYNLRHNPGKPTICHYHFLKLAMEQCKG